MKNKKRILAGLLAVLIHLSHLKSFGVPYLMPFVAADLNDYEDEGGREDTGCGVYTRYPLPSEQFFHSD